MNKAYILTHTPAEMAAENTEMELQIEFDSTNVFYTEDDVETMFGIGDPEDIASAVTADLIPLCDDVLSDWFDCNGEPRPGNANALAMTYTLFSALCIKKRQAD